MLAPAWETVDARRLVARQPGMDEDTITEACADAIRLLGQRLVPHLTRLPSLPSATPSP